LFITLGGVNKASSRYRVLQFLDNLEENMGYIYKIISIPRRSDFKHYPKLQGSLIYSLKRISFYFSILYYCLSWADKVFIQKVILPFIILRLIKMNSIPFIYDLDDAIFMPFSTDKRTKIKKTKVKALAFTLRYAKTVIAGNQVLHDYVIQFRNKCNIIPTVLDLNTYCRQKNTESFNYTIGWIGSSENLVYLNQLIKPLQTLHQEFPQVRLLVICNKSFELEDFTINKRWSKETEIEAMLTMDIGVMPLVNDEWTRGKCAFKALQYMGLGIPTVVSPVGMNKDVIKDGINGYLADSEQEWLDKLRNLILDHNLRQAFSIKGREQIENNYSLDLWQKQWSALVFGADKSLLKPK